MKHKNISSFFSAKLFSMGVARVISGSLHSDVDLCNLALSQSRRNMLCDDSRLTETGKKLFEIPDEDARRECVRDTRNL